MLRKSVFVVGGGPAGCLVAAAAARRGLEVAWCDDDEFRAGMLRRYMDVPANTKLSHLRAQGLFSEIDWFAERSPAVKRAREMMYANVIPNPSNMLRWDPTPQERNIPNGWPSMTEVVRLFASVSRAILDMPNVRRIDGRAAEATRRASKWHVRVGPDDYSADALVMCLGGKPRLLSELTERLSRLPPGIEAPLLLGSEEALDPQKLASVVEKSVTATEPRPNIAVIGNSHTAALLLRNLEERLGFGYPEVTVHARAPVMLAEWLSDVANYKYTAHGLKGLAASFALDDLDKGEKSLLGNELPMADLWSRLRKGYYGLVVSCCGFEYNQMPDLYVESGPEMRETIPSDILQYDPKTASLDLERQLFQSGMTSPEYFVDEIDSPVPVTAFRGGKETKVEGWKGQRLLAWTQFNKRALQIVAEIEKN